MRTSLIKTVLVTAFCATLFGASTTYAQISTSSQRQISEYEQQELGRQTVNTLRHQVPFIEDYFVHSYINRLGAELQPYLPIGLPYQFFLLKSDELNAFAVRGGFIFFFTGLIAAMDSEDELIGVMAHEMAHVTQHHIERMLAQHARIDAMTTAAILGAIIAGSAEAANGVGLVATNYNIDSKLAYSREFEREADRVGLDAIIQAGRNPRGMVAFFRTLNKYSQTRGGQPPEYLSTHPLSTSRMSDLGGRINDHKTPLAQSRDFDIVRARIAMLYSEEPIQRSLRGQSKFMDNYMDALSLSTPLAERLKMLDALFADNGHAVFIVDKAVALADNDLANEAITLLQDTRAQFPDNAAIPYQLANIQLRQEQWSEACSTLESMRKIGNAYIEYEHNLSRCHYEIGSIGLSQYYLATYYDNVGQYVGAKQQYTLALEDDSLSRYHRALIEQRLEELSPTTKR